LHNIVFVVGEKSRVQVDRCDRIPHRCPARCLTVTLTRCQNSGDGVTAPLSTNHGLLSATSRPSRPCNRTVQVEKRTAFSNVANLQRLRRNLHLKSKTLSIQRFAAIYGGGVVGATRQKDRDFEQTHLQAPHLPTRPRHHERQTSCVTRQGKMAVLQMESSHTFDFITLKITVWTSVSAWLRNQSTTSFASPRG